VLLQATSTGNSGAGIPLESMSTGIESDRMCVCGEPLSDHADHGAHWCQQWWICGCLGFTPADSRHGGLGSLLAAQAEELTGRDEGQSSIQPGLSHRIQDPIEKVD
jgi:hypothetical protein